MFDTTCLIPLPSDLFALALHPTLPILTVGLSSGHVYTYRLPSDTQLSPDSSPPPPPASVFAQPLTNGTTSNSTPTFNLTSILPSSSSRRRSSSLSSHGLGSLHTLWQTRRHKASCRALAFSHDGNVCYSAGADGLVKAFDVETGRVRGKIALPHSSSQQETRGTKTGQAKGKTRGQRNGIKEVDAPSVLSVLSPQALLVGQDGGRLGLWDLREGGTQIGGNEGKWAQAWYPHGNEHVADLKPLPVSEESTSGFPKQWVSVGGTTLAVTDIRKGVIGESEDQEVELTSVCVVDGLKKGGTSVGQKVMVGQGDGVVSLFEKGVWGDLDERVVVDKTGMGVESLAEVPVTWGKGKLKMNEKIVATGLEDGKIRFVRVGRNGILTEWDLVHDEIESVLGLGFDSEGRMVSGGGQTVKVWTEASGEPGGARKRDVESDESDEEDISDDSSNEGQQPKSKRKKRKRNKGKDKSGGKVLDFSGIL